VQVHLFIRQEPFTGGLILNEVIRVLVGIAFEHSMDEIFEKAEIAGKALDESELPAARSGLNDIALLYFIRESLGEMVDSKEQFITSLSEKQRQRYWAKDHR